MNDPRQARVEIFEDTMRLCRDDSEVRASLLKSLSGQELIYESDELADALRVGGKADARRTKIVVSRKRTLEAAGDYSGKRVCVHNFASATNPGGGVTKGSNAQEECLCRCSTLYPCLNDHRIKTGFHDMHRSMLRNGSMDALYNGDCIYTPDVLVMKTDEALPRLMPRERWYTVDVITCAAPNLRERPSNSMNPGSGMAAVRIKNSELRKIHTQRVGRILDIARAHGAEVVILGAFGCGAFQNPASVVAEGIAAAVRERMSDFETIEFAVYCPPSDTTNYEAFRRCALI